MKILYVAMADDYGDPARGPSFEDANFRSALEGMGHELVRFDFMAHKNANGKR
jgi:spore maturation protein CgeB